MRLVTCGAAVVSLSLLCSSGCTSIVNGKHQKLAVSSEPAGAILKLDDGTTYTTPVSLQLLRERDYIVTVSKTGHEPQTFTLVRRISWWYAGNLISWGLPGLVVDYFTGSMWRFDEDELNITLHPARRTHLDPAQELGDVAAHQD